MKKQEEHQKLAEQADSIKESYTRAKGKLSSLEDCQSKATKELQEASKKMKKQMRQDSRVLLRK